MSLRNLYIKTHYDSGVGDNILDDFYIKALGTSVEYCRIAGFFSSTSLAVAARGVRGLIENQGKMKLIVSPRLSKEDADIITKATISPEKILGKNMLHEIEEIEDLVDKDHVAALGWLMAKGILEIRVALVYDDAGELFDYEKAREKGLFHIKVGVIKDTKGDVISFSGSINETASGWVKNIEEFKVFKMWEAGQQKYCMDDIEKFNIYWNDNSKNVKTFKMPEVIRKKIIEITPKDINDIKCLRKSRTIQKKDEVNKNELNLFDYQKEAVETWERNNCRTIFEMATGTGKTRAAIGCMVNALKKNKRMVFVIVCPQGTLSLQWKNEIEKLGIELDDYIIAESTMSNWRKSLEKALLNVATGITENCIVYTTCDTFSGDDFIEIVTKNKHNMKYMIIGDEVHGLGAKMISRGLLNIYDLRLGLSATPDRWFDEIGTKKIKDFFGYEKFEFSIKDALVKINPLTNRTYLTPYKYIPYFTTLTGDEIDDYNRLSKRIRKLFHKAKNDEDAADSLENLNFIRANIHKSALNKFTELENILDDWEDEIRDTIIFVTGQQMQTVINIMFDRHISSHKYTKDEGKKPAKKYNGMTERQYIISKFKSNDYQALLAIKCLDEGIDIPSAENAILLASSTNPREYIQRIGRIIRRYPGKEEATLYDIIIVPDYKRLHPELRNLEKRIFEKEMVRIFEIADNAVNSSEVTKKVFSILQEG